MSKKIGWAVRTGIVVLAFLLVLSGVTLVFMPNKGQAVMGFYEEPENSLDVLFIGSSPVRWGISPLVLWHEEGFTSYSRTSTQQAPFTAYNYLAEALETQSPRVVVLFMTKMFGSHNVDSQEVHMRKAVDYMPLSRYKLEIIRETLSRTEKQTLWSYLFPLLRYHDRWKELEKEDFHIMNKLPAQHVYRGQSPYYRMTVYEEFDYSDWDESVSPKEPSAYAEEYLSKMAAILKERGIPLLLVEMPRQDPDYGQHLAYLELADRYQVDFLNLSVPEVMEEMGLNSRDCFWDETHLNANGAEMLSKYLGDYLTEHYELRDRRGEPGMERWDRDYADWDSRRNAVMEDPESLRMYPGDNNVAAADAAAAEAD